MLENQTPLCEPPRKILYLCSCVSPLFPGWSRSPDTPPDAPRYLAIRAAQSRETVREKHQDSGCTDVRTKPEIERCGYIETIEDMQVFSQAPDCN